MVSVRVMMLVMTMVLGLVKGSAPDIKLLYYSPSPIGDNLVTSEIDLYTAAYLPLHEKFIPAMKKRFNMTHILVNNRWDACEACHRQFLGILKSNDIKLFITLVGPVDSATAKGTTSLLKLIITELSVYGNEIFDGFHVPSPDRPISDDEWLYYYTFINVIPSLFANILSNITVSVELPYSRTTESLKLLTSYSLDKVLTRFWVVSVYGVIPGWYSELLRQLTKNELKLRAPFLINFKCSSYNNSYRIEDENTQYNQLKQSHEETLNTGTDSPAIIGYGYYEITDEWWTSWTSDAGFDIEGCPNGNPFAHTSCGLRVANDILNLEYLGLYSLKYRPFQLCLIPRATAQYLSFSVFQQPNTSSSQQLLGETICAPLLHPIWFLIDFQLNFGLLFGPLVVILLVSCVVHFIPGKCCEEEQKKKYNKVPIKVDIKED